MARALGKPKKTVDLHSEAFMEDLDRYERDELLGEAIAYLREQLDAAIYWGYPEIRFIHGKGKGILKQAVYDELRYYKQSGAIANFHPAYHNDDIVVVLIGL
ncbi:MULTISPECIES: Smr/MutS family protein [Sphingobacterium]|uniref:Smr/MutS family protein n=1 Tax=Sphingobacterium hotanense TaxID=649196 RepID=A0ABT7NPL6_9SPHI|nr:MULTISPECIES: Smr/MutS family protein [Sphingobacterium]MDM1049199.1 Smr/MutS family protein [Sphingobacterium hotanense]